LGVRDVSSARIELHIDRLVLDGFAPGDRHGIADALRIELARLLVEGGMPWWPAPGSEVVKPDVRAVEPIPEVTATTLGSRIAHRVHEALSNE
jgi:hypothetical protein